MSCSSCSSNMGRFMCSSYGWTHLMFDSRRSVLKELQQRPPKCIFEDDKLRFMTSLLSLRFDARPRPLPRALHAQYPPSPPRHSPFSPVAPCVCHFLFNTSSSPPTFRLHPALHWSMPHHGDHVLFRVIINAFLFPQSFQDNQRHNQSCASSGTRIFSRL